MPNNYFVTEYELKLIADKIREKGGTNAALTFPQDFVTAIDAISGGGGSVSIDENGYIVLPSTGSGGGGGGGANAHSIRLEFSDSTETTIPVYYNDPFISTLIRSTTPEMYGSKAISCAYLDNEVWCVPTITWETIWNGTVGYYPEQDGTYPYCWIQELANYDIEVGSRWRVTFDNEQYILTAAESSRPDVGTRVIIGNPKYSGGTDNGSSAPFDFFCKFCK